MTLGLAAWMVFENADRLGADIDAGMGVAGGVAKRGAENRNLDRPLGGRAAADAGAADRLGYVELVVKRGDRCGVGRIGQEDGGEEGIADAGPVERAR